MSSIQYTYNYKLQLDGRGFKDDAAVVLQNDRKAVTNFSNIDMTMSLYALNFHRKVYEPGRIQAEILIQTKESDLPTVDLLTTMLLRRTVSLIIEKSHYESGVKKVDSNTTVASNYYIHEISPQFEKRTTRVEIQGKNKSTQGEAVSVNWIYIKLEIFSLDKILTLSKYSQAHFGQALFSDILKNNKDSFQLQFKSTGAYTMTHSQTVATDIRTLSHLGFKQSGDQKEMIQPYLVQYNESFYDFLRRTANRCGEVFYFEGGKLCVGLASGTGTAVNGSRRIIFQRITESPVSIDSYSRDSLKQWDTSDSSYNPGEGNTISDPVKKGEDNFPLDAFPALDTSGKKYSHRYNSETASEDHYVMLFKDQFAHDSVNDLWCGDDAEHVMRTVSLLLNSTSLMELLTNFAISEINSATKAASKAKKTTDKWNKTLSDLAMSSGDKSAVFPKTYTDRGKWITLNYEQDIRDYEQAQMRGMVCVDMGSGFQNVKLGDKITLPSPNQGKTYVVVEIEMSSGKEWQRTYDGFAEGNSPKQGEPSQRFYAIPMAEKTVNGTKTEVFYPPLLPGDPFRRSGAQPAFVIDSDDPTGQGRVRIRFPWQTQFDSTYEDLKMEDLQTELTDAQTDLETAKTTLSLYGENIVISEDKATVSADQKASATAKQFKDALDAVSEKLQTYLTARSNLASAQLKHVITEAGSPWIRMATPMATSGGGMFFCPEKGDEVMVDFENGNVERPYVTGTLYSKNVPAPKAGGRVIVSKNGHTIRMSDPGDSSELLSSLFPPLKLLTMYGVKFPLMDGVATRAMGGIELTDELGFYNIKMSSHDRLVSIASPFGNVKISAFTGISIDAPNGDISICGKNIELSAYNKITLNSGKNVKLAKDKHRGGWLTTGQDWEDVGKHLGKSLPKLFGIGNLFDLTLFRTIIEVFLRPIDGSLEIKSERFLLLGAGGQTPVGEFADYNVAPLEDKRNRTIDPNLIKSLLAYVKNSLDSWVADFVKKYNDVIDILTDTTGTGIHIIEAWTADPATHIAPLSAPNDLTAMLRSMAAKDPNVLKTNADIDRDFVKNYLSTITVDGSIARASADALIKRIKNLMKAMVELKRHLASYNYAGVFNKMGDLSFLSGFWTLKRAKDCQLASLLPATEVNAILTMDTPMVAAPAAPAPAPPGGAPALAAPAVIPTLQYSTVEAGATPNTGFYSLKIKVADDFFNRNVGDATVFNAKITAAHVDPWKKAVLRRLMSVVIEKLRGTNPFDTLVVEAAKYNPVNNVATEPTKMDLPYSDADWTKYVNEITINPPEKSESGKAKFLAGLAAGFKASVVDKVIPFESDTWSSEKDGQVLFSEKKGATYHFNDSGVTSRSNETRQGAYAKQIKDDLNAI